MESNRNLQESTTGENMRQALERIQKGFSVRGTAKLFGIPKSTMEDRVKERYRSSQKGAATVLSAEEETKVVGWVIAMAHAGFPVNEKILMIQVGEAVKHLGKPDAFKTELPSRGWVQRFMKRHPQLSRRIANNLAKRRVVRAEDIRQWFQDVGVYLKDTNVLEIMADPTRIFNMDESSIALVPTRQKVIAPKGSKNVQSLSLNSEKENYTVLISASAAGKLAPPLVLFPYKSRIPTSVIRSIPKGWGVGRTDSGWMNSKAFHDFIVNVFYPWAVSQNLQFPIILFVDGHSSHATFETVNFCREKQIILVSLPPNSTHFMQPLDVAFFGPMKAAWQKNLKMWRFENQGAMIARADFAPLLEKTLNSMENVEEMLINGFRKCGLVPFDENAIDYASLADPTAAPAPLAVDLGHQPLEELAEIQDNESESVQENGSDASKLLQYLNGKLQPAQLESFKTHRNKLVWQGDVQDTSLFAIWRNLTDEVEGPPEYLMIDSPLIVQIEDPIAETSEVGPDIENGDTFNMDYDFWNPTEHMSGGNDEEPPMAENNEPTTLEHDSSINLQHHDDDPDEELGEPSSGVSIRPLKRKRAAYPCVATSDEWMKMYEADEREKQDQENFKKLRLEQRNAKKLLREEEKRMREQEKHRKAEEKQRNEEEKLKKKEEEKQRKEEEKLKKKEEAKQRKAENSNRNR